MNDIYSNAQHRLATLLGWTGLQFGGKDGETNIPPTWLTGFAPDSLQVEENRDLVPMWTQSGDEFLELMGEYCLKVDVFDKRVEVNDNDPEYFDDHGGDIKKTIKYAGVIAVILHLEALKPDHRGPGK